MKIRQKLLLSYLIIIALFVAAGATITYSAERVSALQNNVKQQEEINDNAYTYQEGFDQMEFGTLMYSAYQAQEGEQILSTAYADTKSQTFLVNALASNPALLAQFDSVLALSNNTIYPEINQIVSIYNSNLDIIDKDNQIWNLMTSIMNATNQGDAQLAVIRGEIQTNVQNANDAQQSYTNFSIIAIVAFIGIISAVSVTISVVMGKRITNPLKKLATVAQKVSQGDLDQRYYLKQNADPKKGDEIDDLADAFKKMINAFRMQEALLKEDEGKENK